MKYIWPILILLISSSCSTLKNEYVAHDTKLEEGLYFAKTKPSYWQWADTCFFINVSENNAKLYIFSNDTYYHVRQWKEVVLPYLPNSSIPYKKNRSRYINLKDNEYYLFNKYKISKDSNITEEYCNRFCSKIYNGFNKLTTEKKFDVLQNYVYGWKKRREVFSSINDSVIEFRKIADGIDLLLTHNEYKEKIDKITLEYINNNIKR